MGSNQSSRSSPVRRPRETDNHVSNAGRRRRENSNNNNNNNDNMDSDIDDSVDDTSSASDSDARNAEDLISVFQVLIRNGQIHIMSSGDESDDVAYSPTHRVAKAPRVTYKADLDVIHKNDIDLKLRNTVGLNSKVEKALPKLLTARELGQTTTPGRTILGGFDAPHRHLINNRFLPNTVQKIANYGNKAFCGMYSKQGNIFLSASQDRFIRIYDTTKGRFQLFKTIQARDVGWSVLDTAFSNDGRYVCYSSWSESIHICNIYGEVERHESLCLCPDNRRFCIFSLVFSENSEEILGGANDGFLYIYDRGSNQRVLKIEAHGDDVNSVAFADETSNILFSAADDGLCKAWDRRTLSEADPVPIGIFTGHIDGICSIEAKGDGRYLITNSKDQSIKLWDMRAFSSAEAVRNTKRQNSLSHWDYRWQRVPKRLCVPREREEGDSSIMTYRGHSVLNTLIRCRFSPAYSTGQRFIYTGCAAGRVVIYDVLTGNIEKILKGHRACVRDIHWHPSRNEIVSTSWDHTVGLWTYIGNHSIDSDEEGVNSIETSDPPRKKLNLRRSSRIAAKRHQPQPHNPEPDPETG